MRQCSYALVEVLTAKLGGYLFYLIANRYNIAISTITPTMGVFRKLIALFLVFNIIKSTRSAGTDGCSCFEDCVQLTRVMNEHNKMRESPGPEKLYVPGNDTNKCVRAQDTCCLKSSCVGPPESSMAILEVEQKGMWLQECMGVVIDPQAILTTASCFSEFPAKSKNPRIVIGGTHYEYAKHTIHVNYAHHTSPTAYNVALIKPKVPVTFSDKVKKACLSTGYDQLASDAECGLVNGPKVAAPKNCWGGVCDYVHTGTTTMKHVGLWCKNKYGETVVVALVPDTTQKVAILLEQYSSWIQEALALLQQK